MTSFEDWISMIRNKDEAISIHRTAVYIERFNILDTDREGLLLDGKYYNAVTRFRKEHNNDIMIDDSSVTWHFRKDPAYADKYLKAVLQDKNEKEIVIVSQWCRLAKALGSIRRRTMRKA